MRHRSQWMAVAVLALLAALPQLAACTQQSAEATSHSEPASVQKDEAAGTSRLTLTADAARRLDLHTATVRETEVADGKRRTIIPYGAVLYDAKGATSAYVSPKALEFVRQPIRVDYIEGDLAVLLDGPPAGTAVVTVGAAELHGIETGVDSH